MFLEEFNEELYQKAIRDEALEEGINQGITKGITKGIAKGKALDILELLSDLGDIPAELQTVIMEQQDCTILTNWLKIASKSNSIEEFIKNYKL